MALLATLRFLSCSPVNDSLNIRATKATAYIPNASCIRSPKPRRNRLIFLSDPCVFFSYPASRLRQTCRSYEHPRTYACTFLSPWNFKISRVWPALTEIWSRLSVRFVQSYQWCWKLPHMHLYMYITHACRARTTECVDVKDIFNTLSDDTCISFVKYRMSKSLILFLIYIFKIFNIN